MKTQRQIRPEVSPDPRKKEQLDTVLASIRDDARSLSPSYSKQTIVPEGGE